MMNFNMSHYRKLQLCRFLIVQIPALALLAILLYGDFPKVQSIFKSIFSYLLGVEIVINFGKYIPVYTNHNLSSKEL
ncbi:TPA: hypothetical protein VA186_000435 [Streptococcus agalactiae]|nr:hypothetical protein [Streptococcus agalactiae]